MAHRAHSVVVVLLFWLRAHSLLGPSVQLVEFTVPTSKCAFMRNTSYTPGRKHKSRVECFHSKTNTRKMSTNLQKCSALKWGHNIEIRSNSLSLCLIEASQPHAVHQYCKTASIGTVERKQGYTVDTRHLYGIQYLWPPRPPLHRLKTDKGHVMVTHKTAQTLGKSEEHVAKNLLKLFATY